MVGHNHTKPNNKSEPIKIARVESTQQVHLHRLRPKYDHFGLTWHRAHLNRMGNGSCRTNRLIIVFGFEYHTRGHMSDTTFDTLTRGAGKRGRLRTKCNGSQ